jgi:hypothetical protein
MIYFIIGILLIIISAISESIMDKIQFHFEKSIFNDNSYNRLFWNPLYSWENKWNKDLTKPKFFLSTTLLVFLTDGWHFFKFLRNTTLFIGLPLLVLSPINIIISVIIARIVYGLVFTLFFDKLLDK